MSWLEKMFGTKKVIIGLLHLKALPGDPFYEGDMGTVIASAKADLKALQKGGVDGILITNEFSLPYEKQVSKVTLAAMGRIIGAIEKEIEVPYGVEAIYDADATIEICAATDACFSRCVFTGAYAGDLGLVDRDVAKTLRRRNALGMQQLKLFYFVNSEGEVYLNDRSIEDITKTMIFNCHPEALVVAGGMAGSSPQDLLLKMVKEHSEESIPVFCGTGCRLENIEQIFQIADGAFVGTTFKKDGDFEAGIDYERVKKFMDKVRKIRGEA
ncbi:MAG: BtpA/SgcQ family protein [Hespellia sp.]|nr:BtpA/SgcQ family protein [Hespellia sp.]